MSVDDMVQALRGQRNGHGWVAHCPAHDDRKPSLSIDCSEDGKVLVHCHAGCDKAAVIEALVDRGLWRRCQPADVIMAGHSKNRGSRNTKFALDIWAASRGALGTPAELYLRSRAITISPPALRFHPRLKHSSGAYLPAMVAIVTNAQTGEPMAIHRTYLDNLKSTKADIAPNKMMLGPTRGGVVRLANADEAVMVGEGIETCLSAMQATGQPTWAALSASGLRALELPPQIKTVTILVDGDRAGAQAATHSARRWVLQRRHVRIARAPEGFDFNDLLVSAAKAPPGTVA